MPTALGVGVSLDLAGVLSGPDSTPPIITNVVLTETALATGLAGASLVLTCATNEPCTVVAQYGPTTGYGSSVGPSVLGTTHTLTIPGQTGNTLVHVRPVATDAASNATNGADVPITTTDTPYSIWGANLMGWYSMYLDGRPEGQSLADGALVATATDFSGRTNTLVASGAQRGPYQAAGMNGSPALFFDNVNTLLRAAADQNDLDLTADRFTGLVVASIASAAADAIVAHWDVTTNTRRWDLSLTAAGQFSTFGDTKGVAQNTTAATFRDGTTQAIGANRSAGTETIYTPGATHDAFTGMGNTAPTGLVRVGMFPTGSNIYNGWIAEMVFVNRAATVAEITRYWAWVG